MTSHIKFIEHIFVQQIVIENKREREKRKKGNQLNLNGKSIANIFSQPFHAMMIDITYGCAAYFLRLSM